MSGPFGLLPEPVQTTVYRTPSTGQLFAKWEEARDHEFERQLDGFADRYGLCSGGEWDASMVLECLKANWAELAAIFAIRAAAEPTGRFRRHE